ncbi:PIN domain-containing protein [Brevundimonas sp.]|uniref:PIN domain-containing protein n=1 Tax=Brevundimonas sp. TaxID=1871086 RepID=UPI003F6F8B69
MLIDTCVWLDLAKDHRQQATLACLEALMEQGQVALILPETVVEEFGRNKERVIRESGQSLSSLFRRVKDTVERFGEEGTRMDVVRRLDEIDHRVATLGEAAVGAVNRIEALFAASTPIPAGEGVKVRVADRAIRGQAPFHRQKNSANDAILIEHYRDAIDELVLPDRAAFVTHNIKDFSEPSGDSRRPHPDLADLFGEDSVYSISLSEMLGAFAPELLEEVRFETEWSLDYRRLSEIIEAMDDLTDKVWYNRHWGLRNQVASGEISVVEDRDYPVGRYPQDLMSRQTWEGALAAAKKVEARRPNDLGPWTDFEWGMINGKLSALRWMLGDDWDMLDT